jgi:hypothetical protein
MNQAAGPLNNKMLVERFQASIDLLLPVPSSLKRKKIFSCSSLEQIQTYMISPNKKYISL